jgi:hypothetical protein
VFVETVLFQQSGDGPVIDPAPLMARLPLMVLSYTTGGAQRSQAPALLGAIAAYGGAE